MRVELVPAINSALPPPPCPVPPPPPPPYRSPLKSILTTHESTGQTVDSICFLASTNSLDLLPVWIVPVGSEPTNSLSYGMHANATCLQLAVTSGCGHSKGMGVERKGAEGEDHFGDRRGGVCAALRLQTKGGLD